MLFHDTHDQELVGTLRGFDDYVNMVLDDVTEYEIDADGTKRRIQLDQVRCITFYRNPAGVFL